MDRNEIYDDENFFTIWYRWNGIREFLRIFKSSWQMIKSDWNPSQSYYDAGLNWKVPRDDIKNSIKTSIVTLKCLEIHLNQQYVCILIHLHMLLHSLNIIFCVSSRTHFLSRHLTKYYSTSVDVWVYFYFQTQQTFKHRFKDFFSFPVLKKLKIHTCSLVLVRRCFRLDACAILFVINKEKKTLK